jgi:hypothetical protein
LIINFLISVSNICLTGGQEPQAPGHPHAGNG